jgi:putative acetyltransferase
MTTTGGPVGGAVNHLGGVAGEVERRTAQQVVAVDVRQSHAFCKEQNARHCRTPLNSALGPMIDAMHIRPFHVGDEPALFRVFYSAIHEIACRYYSSEQINAWAPDDMDMDIWHERMRGIRPFVVEIEGEIAAYADVQATGYIDHFFVAGPHARRGIGSALMNRIHEEAAGLVLVELTSDVSRAAQPFFATFGFEIVEHRTPVIRGVAVPNVLMRKDLSAESHCRE